MPSKDLTWNLFGRDVNASSTFKALGTEVEQVALRAKVHADEFDRSSSKLTADLAKAGAASLSMGVSFARAQMDAAKSIDALGSAMQREVPLFDKLKSSLRDSEGAVIEFGKNASGTLPQIPPMFGLIAAGAALTGPAVGAAAGAIVAAGAAAGVSFLAFKGFQEEMKRGTPLGRELTSSLGGLTGEFHRLAAVAATGASGGVLGSLKQLHAFLPTLEPMVGGLATSLGRALNIGTGGLITGLKVMAPLMSDAGRYAEQLASKFAAFAASPEFKRFIDYARQELPVVMKDLGDLAEAGIKLGVALQPVGEKLLARLDGIAKGADMLLGPIGKLTAATGDGGGLGGAFKFVTKVIDPIGSALENLGNKHKKAAADTGLMTQAELLAAASADAYAATQGTTGAAVDSATAAIKSQKDALAATTEKMVLENDAAGLLKQALDALNAGNLSAAESQNAFDQAIVNTRTNVGKTSQTLVDAQVRQEKAQDAVNKAQASGKTTADQLTAVNAALAKANYALAVAEDKAGTRLDGMSAAAVKNRGTLNGLASGAETAAEKYGKMTDANGHLVHGSEDARQKFIQLRSQVIAAAVATGMNRGEVIKYVDSILRIPPKASTTTILHTTDAENAAATFKAHLAEIARMRVQARIFGDARIDQAENLLNYAARDRTAVITALVQGDARLGTARGATGGLMTGGRFAFDSGGYVAGRGSWTSDSNLAAVSNGEYVVRAAAVARVGVPFMNALNRAGGGGVGNAPVGGGTHIEVHVHNAVIGNKAELARTVVSALAPFYRNGGARP